MVVSLSHNNNVAKANDVNNSAVKGNGVNNRVESVDNSVVVVVEADDV
jgi:hypothetical protein